MKKYRKKILERADKYYRNLNELDFSHNFDHVLRVERLAKRIAEDEGADIHIIEAACLLFDVARELEDKGEVQDHARAGSEIARKILNEIDFPKKKVESVCHAILTHRKSKDMTPETIEAKILQDADYLDAMGAVDIARVIASGIQSEKYRRPVFMDIPYEDGMDPNTTSIHYCLYKLKHPKMQPENFHTKLGKKFAYARYNFMKEYTERFIKEWRGEL